MELRFLQLKPASISQDTSGCVASTHNVHLRGRSQQVAPRVCFIQELIEPVCVPAVLGTLAVWRHTKKKQDGIIRANLTVPYRSADYLTLGTKLCLEYLSKPLQINFLATGTLTANDFHSALPTPVRLLKYSSYCSWSRCCMCFVILLMCHICCILAYTSLSSF